MYRKRNGSMGFSFTRFANAAVPSFFAENTKVVMTSLEPLRRDMLYAYQISSQSPFALDERTFFVCGIVDSEGLSKKTHKALRKAQVLRDDDTVDTYKIGGKFVHQLAVISLNRQRDLINMLFWWEEECQRLRKLFDEEKELDTMIAENEQTNSEDAASKEVLDQLKFARERVRMKKRQSPSQRRADIEADKDDIHLAYSHGRSKSVPNMGGHAPDRTERPPEYYAPR